MSPELFETICFIVLMENQDGLRGKHPSYVLEKKLATRGAGYGAITLLDDGNQRKVLSYLERWGIEPPEEVLDYLSPYGLPLK